MAKKTVDVKKQMNAAKAFALLWMDECSWDLLEGKKTGIFPEGKFLQLTHMCESLGALPQSMAESILVRALLEFHAGRCLA